MCSLCYKFEKWNKFIESLVSKGLASGNSFTSFKVKLVYMMFSVILLLVSLYKGFVFIPLALAITIGHELEKMQLHLKLLSKSLRISEREVLTKVIYDTIISFFKIILTVGVVVEMMLWMANITKTGVNV